MATNLHEQTKAVIEKFQDRLPKKMQQAAEDAVIKILEEGQWPKDALGFTPAMMETLYNYGYQMFQGGKYPQALKCFIVLRRWDPTSFRYSFGIAACYQYMKKYSEAAGNYMLCTCLDPENPIPYFHMYDCFIQQNDPYAGLQALSDMIACAGDNPLYAELKQRGVLEYNRLKQEVKKLKEAQPSSSKEEA